jgi:transcriptional regulator with XRE-family HTH domain
MSPETIHEERYRLGRELRSLRRQKDLSQQNIADLIGTIRSQISRLETGSHSVGIDTFIAYAQAIGYTFQITPSP